VSRRLRSSAFSGAFSSVVFALSAAFGAGCAAAPPTPSEARRPLDELLDGFHRAASKCDLERYFEPFSDSGVFLGTDASERWSKAEFRAFCEPYFARGQGWTYTPIERHVSLDSQRKTAWFDERLSNEKYGEVRGSGVLVRGADGWRIEQYVMSFPVPNELAGEWLKLLRSSPASRP
jgi:hypothetical protein